MTIEATRVSEIQNATRRTVCPGHRGVDIPVYLAGPLQAYFILLRQTPLPQRLTDLLQLFEARVTGGCASETFREDLIHALPALRTFALTLCGNPAGADDLVQETMVKAWVNHGKFLPGTNFSAWVFTILRNQFYTECRKARREVEDEEGIHAAALTAPAVQEHSAALGSVMKLIGTLPAAQRQALLLVGAEGFTYEEAADQIGCRVGTVKSRVSRTRTFLVDTLNRSKPTAALEHP